MGLVDEARQKSKAIKEEQEAKEKAKRQQELELRQLAANNSYESEKKSMLAQINHAAEAGSNYIIFRNFLSLNSNKLAQFLKDEGFTVNQRCDFRCGYEDIPNPNDFVYILEISW